MLALLPGWLDPEQIIEQGGLWLGAAIVFAESGLLIGFFLPGDSLLFVAGFPTSQPADPPPVNQPLPPVLDGEVRGANDDGSTRGAGDQVNAVGEQPAD